MTRPKKKGPAIPPPLFVVIYNDTDGSVHAADLAYNRHRALGVAREWREWDTSGLRTYRVVEYRPVRR
jgi:hypothetical protein